MGRQKREPCCELWQQTTLWPDCQNECPTAQNSHIRQNSVKVPALPQSHLQTHTYTRQTGSKQHNWCIYTHLNRAKQSNMMYWITIQQAACVLTLSLGADQAGWGVTEWAQNGSYGQAQVLVARVQSDRGKAQVRQAGSFLWTNLYMRDL